MTTTQVLAALLLASCGRSAPPTRPAADRAAAVATPATAATAATAAPAADAAPAPSLEAIRAQSGCAFESRDALCDAFREHFASSGSGWVSDGCAWGAPRSSSGPFAEAALLGVRVGYGEATGARVERPLLGGAVREPTAGDPGTTQVVLVARVGRAWFPIHLYFPREANGREGGAEWALDASGATLSWTDGQGAERRSEPGGYGRTERSIAVVERGVPMLAATAATEQWRSDVDLACTRACNGAPAPPPYPECSRRCESRVRVTRSWEQAGATLRIGATVVERHGPAAAGMDAREEPALTRRLDANDQWLGFCAFMPVVRAIARAAPPSDDASVAARASALAVLQSGTPRALAGVAAVVVPGAARSRLEVRGTLGTACGGGGCTTGVLYQTLEGPMPERGVGYFANERGNQLGCDAATLPPPGAGSTYVEVAPATSREAIGCGFSGFDGTARRYWVVTRVFAPRR